MTITAEDGPLVTKGWEAALGSAAGTSSATGAPNPYISGQDNPDAGPNVFYAGEQVKDPLWRYREGGGSLIATGYPNQALGFLSNECFAADFIPSAVSTTNIAALQAPTIATPLTLVAVAGAGITILTAPLTVLNSQQVVPIGARQIDATPTWFGFGTSGAIQAWNGTGIARCVSLTSAADLTGINFTLKGLDIYGFPFTSTIAGPGVGLTVLFPKAAKWVISITPSATSASTVSVGTSDTYEFPLRTSKFSENTIYVNQTLITVSTGFTAADLTAPATALTKDVRGTYAWQAASGTSDGTKAMQIYQRLGAGRLSTTPPALGMFGQPQH